MSLYSCLDTWGHPILDDFEDDLSNAIICNGRWILVGLNLMEALWFFFAEKLSHSDRLWVDAVCIDQSNLTERGEQIQHMTQLYAYAKEVLVWLGHEDADARCAFDFLEEYVPLVKRIIRSEMAENPTADLVPESKNICDDASFHRRYGTKQRSLGEWRSLISFFSRRWFKRTWVIHETIINTGPTLYCGLSLPDLELSMTEMATIFTLHRNIREELRPELSDGTVVPTVEADVRTFKFFEDRVIRTSMLQATDARDKIYSLTGLIRAYTIANDLGVDIPTKADYEAPISKVFREFTMLILYATRSLDIWSYVIDKSARRPDVSAPSWVPQLYQPSAGIMWNLMTCGERIQDVWWRTLIADQTMLAYPAPDEAGAKKADEARTSFREFVPLLNPKITGQASLALFRTRRGYIGLCPHSTREGDEVWLLKGAKVSFIFRKVGPKLHEMMGESYVHGLMQGQFLEPGSQNWDSIFIK
ncbi:heterokaryon incompatibility protein-domain-containing protein [Xylariaceae sp. AK1471]|nr:heterokaryon incompatibility protein-domain-containing protein [Xylariaceae sp. AK1471]